MVDPVPISQGALLHRLEERLEEIALKAGGGGGTSNGMEGRVTRLEVHMEHIREDLTEIKGDLKATLSKLGDMPTKSDLWSWKLQWTAIGIGMVALIVGGIIGGLAWIQPEPNPAPAPQPIVVTIPK